MARVNLTIPDEQKEWLDEHPSVNVSGLLQEVITAVRKRREQAEAQMNGFVPKGFGDGEEGIFPVSLVCIDHPDVKAEHEPVEGSVTKGLERVSCPECGRETTRINSSF